MFLRYYYMKTYNAIFNAENEQGVFGISLVKAPATEQNWVALSKQEQAIQFKEVNKDQQILLGLVLQPNQKIYRVNEETQEEFNIVFSEETIKELSYNFFKQGFQSNSTIEHSNKIDGVTFVESWIVEDSEKDKSSLYGFSYPKGSWLATMKVDDADLWNNYVKTGKVQGFSIDAMLDLKEINFKSESNMSKVESTFLDSLTALLGLNKQDEIKEVKEVKEVEKQKVEFGEIKTSDGEITIMYEGETPTVGADLYVMQGEERIPIPQGEYPTEAGIMVVDENSKLAEIKPLQEEVAEVETEMSDSEIEQAIKSILVKYSEQVNSKLEAFGTKLSEVTKENESLKNELVEFSKKPSAKPITATPTAAKTAKERIYNTILKNQ